MSNHDTLHLLIEACLRGERKAQEELFNKHAGVMMTLCRRYTRNHQEAEDLLQEGFIKAFSHLGDFGYSGSFEGWLKRIFVNIALKQIQKKSFLNEQSGLDNVYEEGKESDIISILNEEEILKVVDDLPLGYKTVFNLYVIEDYSHKEIAELLQIEESTSRSQLVKARKILQEKLNDLNKIA